MKRILLSNLLVMMSVVIYAKQTTVNATDTIVRDLTELEAKLANEDIEEKKDSTYYGERKQSNINALQYSLDRRHRYKGDTWYKGTFGNHTFVDFGANVVLYQANNHYKLTPQTGVQLRLGKELSPMSTLRFGFGGELGYVRGEANVNWTIRTGVDYLFNFSNYLLGNRPERPLQVSGVIGVGMQHSKLNKYEGSDVSNYMKGQATSFNAKAGLQFRFMAGAHAALAIEPYVMAGTEGMDLDLRRKFNHFSFGYGVNLSYIWYFYNNLSHESQAGDLKRIYAQDERLFSNNPIKHNWRRPWFFDYHIGPVYYSRTPLSSKETLGYSMSAGLGQWLSSAIGVRGGISITNAAWNAEKDTKSLLGKSGFYVDALLNPFGFTRHYNWDSPIGINLLGGYEMGKLQLVHANINDKTSGTYSGYRFGMQLWAKITDDLRLNFEPSYMLLEHFDRPDARVHYNQMDYKIGLSLLFRGKQHRFKDLEPDKNDLPMSGFFIGGGLGWNTTVNKWRYTGYNRGLLLNMNGFVGYNFDCYHGAKIVADYIVNPIFEKRYGQSIGQKKEYKNTFISFDYQVNALNLMTGYKANRRWGVHLYGGPSLVLSNVGRRLDLGFNAGGMLSYRILPNLLLYYSHTIYWMRSQHYDSPQIYTTPGAVTNVLSVGAQYHLNGFFNQIANLPWKNAPHSGRHKFFLDYGYGYGLYPQLPNKAMDSKGSTMHLALGWWGNSFVGARFGLNMSKASAITTINTDNHRTEKLIHGMGIATLSGDLLFNPMGLSKNYNWNSMVGAHLILGYQNGLLVLNDEERSIKGSNVTVHGFRLGSQLWFRLSKDLKFTIEPMYAVLNTGTDIYINDTKTQLYKTSVAGSKPMEIGNAFSVKLGISLLLNRFGRYEDVEMKSYIEKQPKRFFGALGAGWNILLSKHRFANKGANINLSMFGGYHLSEVSAIRLGLEYVTDDLRYGITYGQATDLIDIKQNIAFASLAYNIDLLAFFKGYDISRKWNLNLYGGPAIGVLLNKEKTKEPAINGGLTLDYKVGKTWSAFYNHNFYILGLIKESALLPGTNLLGRVTALNTINLGVMYRF